MTRGSVEKAKRRRTEALLRAETYILVVEDSPTQAEALRGLLADAGYQVALASSGEDGLAQFDAGEFDVVISDIIMPGAVDGYALCRRIKAGKRRETPVVLLTSLSDPLDIISGLECGADNFFSKSLEPVLLLDRLKLLLTTRETRARGKLRMGVQVFFMGREFTITSEREQILDLLISTFEDAVRQNRELRQREEELNAAKEELAQYAGSLEDRLRSVLNSVPDVLFSMSRDGGQVHYISPAAAQVFGYGAEEVRADTDVWYRRVSPEDEASVRASLELAVATGKSQTVEYRFRHRDESVRGIQTTFVPVSDGSGVVSRVDGISRDVTQQRRLEEQFRQAQKMEAVGQLAGGVAHDFNNLLTVITSYGDLLLSDLEATDPRRKDVEEIRKAALGAAGLTRQLLAFSRQQVLEPRVLELNAIVSSAEKMLQRLIGEDIGLVTVLAPDLGAVKADPGQLEQVIMNLAVNARDAMPEGGKLTLETANMELDATYTAEHTPVRPGAYVVLSVSDTGVGMDEQTKRRIFEPFFTTKEQGKGTGLGLATVYGIVKQSGGFIWVYSEVGHGTTFKVYFPRVDEPADVAQRAATLPASVRGTETVLLAEDAAALRAVARRVLERGGYTVLEAPSGKTALDLAVEHDGRIHLLITDVIMPEMSGRQLAERLKEQRPELKVLFVSGYTDDSIIRHGILEPGIAFLQKPFSPEVLARKVREVLDSPRLR